MTHAFSQFNFSEPHTYLQVDQTGIIFIAVAIISFRFFLNYPLERIRAEVYEVETVEMYLFFTSGYLVFRYR